MSLNITRKICIERDGKIISAYDAESIRKAVINGTELDNIFIVSDSESNLNLVRVYDDNSVKETNFKDCRIIGDFESGNIARVLFCDDDRIQTNYITTELELLFNGEYDDVTRVDDKLFIVSKHDVEQAERGCIYNIRYGVINIDGDVLIECIYSDIKYNKEAHTFTTKM